MMQISYSNPYVFQVISLFLSIGGYVYWTLTQESLYLPFFVSFLILNLLLLWVSCSLAIRLEKKTFFHVVKASSSFIFLLLGIRFMLNVYVLGRPGETDFSSERMKVYESGIPFFLNYLTSILLVPMMLLVTRGIWRKLVFFTFVMTVVINALKMPSKSTILSVILNLIVYQYFRLKLQGRRGASIFSIKSIIFIFLALVATVSWLEINGIPSISTLTFRISQNFDQAILISRDYKLLNPPYGIFFYDFLLPFLKGLDPLWRELEYYNIPQYLGDIFFGHSRHTYFGGMNDNLFAGMLISYGIGIGFVWSLFFILIYFYLSDKIIKSPFSIGGIYVIVFGITFFSSLQEFIIVSSLFVVLSILDKIGHWSLRNLAVLYKTRGQKVVK